MKTDEKASWIRNALERFESSLTRYAFGITRDRELARDVVQDTFLRLCLEDPARLDGHLAPWLFKVCRNRALDLRKKEARRRAHPADPEPGERAHPLPSTELEAREGVSRVLAVLSTLPEDQQEVIRLRFQGELSYREIGEVTGLTVSNVGFLLHHGLRTLRARFQQSFQGGSHVRPSGRS